MKNIFLIIVFSTLFLHCATNNVKEFKRWKEKFRVENSGDTLRRVNIPLGEIEKFSIDLYANRSGTKSINFTTEVTFTDTTKTSKLHFILGNQINAKEYLSIDTILTCTMNGKYNFKLLKRNLKGRSVIVFLEGWVGYLMEK